MSEQWTGQFTLALMRSSHSSRVRAAWRLKARMAPFSARAVSVVEAA